MQTDDLIRLAARAIEVIGVLVIVIGLLYATVIFFEHIRPRRRASEAYRLYRHDLGSAILLGLEFLIAADIIRSVGISPTFESIGVLAGIILIRTFLSMALELEIEGHWPWDRGRIGSTPPERRPPSGDGEESERVPPD